MKYLCSLIMITKGNENTTKSDINSIEDVRALVDAFYAEVRKNPVIGPIFIGAVRDQLSQL